MRFLELRKTDANESPNRGDLKRHTAGRQKDVILTWRSSLGIQALNCLFKQLDESQPVLGIFVVCASSVIFLLSD